MVEKMLHKPRLFFFLIPIGACFCEGLLLSASIEPVLSHLWMRNPIFFCDHYALNITKVQRFKQLSKERTETMWAKLSLNNLGEHQLKSSGMVVCLPDSTDFDSKLVSLLTQYPRCSRSFPWVIIGKDAEDRLSKLLSIKLDEQIYFFDLERLVLSEAYEVNDNFVRRDLAWLTIKTEEHRETGGKYSLQVITAEPVFLKRRANLGGLNLRTVVGYQIPFAMFPMAKAEEGSYVQLDDADVGGIFYDLLSHMKRDMNFTTTLFYRTDKDWGNRQVMICRQ